VNNSLVSIIIPTFNRAHLLGETIDSILAQSYAKWECIIVDDGSTDETEGLVNCYLEKDKRFKYLKRPSNRRKGANACRNYGFEMSKGEYINWFDSDDIMHKDFLKDKISILENNGDIDFSCCISKTFKNNTDNILSVDRPTILNSLNFIEDYLINGLYFYTPSPLWRKSFLLNKSHFDETLYRSQERDFHFRMLTYHPKYIYLDKVLFYIRQTNDNITAKAATSLRSQESIFKYFNKVFSYLKSTKDLKEKYKLLKYVIYRQGTNYYNINQCATGFLGRLRVFVIYSRYMISYFLISKKLIPHLLKINIGFLFLLITGKGYKYFYFQNFKPKKC
jgi:glycosyltransferase involved in cell wall biosynthesis